MIRSMSEFRVVPGQAAAFEKAYRDGQFLERATTNPGFVRGELVRSADDPDVFHALAEWRSIEHYRDWQANYDALPQEPSRAMFAALAEPPSSSIHEVLLTADEHTEIRED